MSVHKRRAEREKENAKAIISPPVKVFLPITIPSFYRWPVFINGVYFLGYINTSS